MRKGKGKFFNVLLIFFGMGYNEIMLFLFFFIFDNNKIVNYV